METQRSLHHYHELSPTQLRIFRCASALAGLLLVPVPWKVDMSTTYGFANSLNDSLEVNGEMVDPPGEGEWSRLGVIGRPQFVGEVVMEKVFGEADSSKDMRSGPELSKPSVGVPAAARVGLEHAGTPTVELEASVWHNLILDRDLASIINNSTMDRMTNMLNYADENLKLDSFHTGGSHGMMVALATYSHAAEVDLAQGRHIAGTGGIKSGGEISSIGSLPTKAKAADRAGVDILLVPASQKDQLNKLLLPNTEIVPVETLQEAIDFLSVPTGED